MKIFLIGVQGSGKSTQGKLLALSLGLPYISTGDIFRSMEGEIKKTLEEGRLVDDQTTARVVKEKLQTKEYENGFIMDGYPRTLEQIRLFDPQFDKVFYLDLPDEDAINRLLKRARQDDTVELISQRIKDYHQLTDPIVDYYQQKGILTTVNGLGSIGKIQQKLRDLVND